MMKKLFSSPLTAAILAALTFAACTDSESLVDNPTAQAENSADNTVQFDTYLGQQSTRAYEGSYAGGSITNTTATNDGTTALKTVGFGVFAYHSGNQTLNAWGSWDGTAANPVSMSGKAPNFMYNEKITWNSTNNYWDYSPVKYWPNGTDAANADGAPSNTATEIDVQYLSFFAYAPYTSIAGSDYDASSDGAFPTTPAVSAATKTGNDNGIVAISKNSETTDMQVKYAFKDAADESSAVDLLWGLRGQKTYGETDGENNTITTLGTTYNTDLTKQTVGEKVKFLFKHALARVGGSTSSSTAAGSDQICGLKVVVDVDKNETANSATATDHSAQTTYFASDFNNAKTLVTLKEVKIRDQYTYSQEVGSTITTTASDFASSGWFDIMNGIWTKSETPTSGNGITYSVTANSTASVDNTAPYALNTDIKEGTVNNSGGADWTTSNSGGATGVTTSLKNVFADENVPGLLLIPGTNSNTLYVTVDYVVRTADSKLSTGYTEVEQVITNMVTLDGSILKPNKYYTLVMHLGLTSVKFEAVVANWSDSTTENYNENGEDSGTSDAVTASIYLPSNVVESNAVSTTATVGTNQAVTVAAATTSYAITLDNLQEAKIYSDAGCSSELTTGGYSVTSEGNVATVTIPANTSSKNKVVYVKVTNTSSGASVITITQKAAALSVTHSYSPDLSDSKMTNAVTTITLDINDAGGSDLDLSSGNSASNVATINVDPSTDVNISYTSTGATISIPAQATGATERTFNISVKVNDAPTYTFSISQAAGASE